jgi:hypothetical protein
VENVPIEKNYEKLKDYQEGIYYEIYWEDIFSAISRAK